VIPDSKSSDREADARSLLDYLEKPSVKIAPLAKAWKDGVATITGEDLAAAKAAVAGDTQRVVRVADIVRATRRAPPPIRSAVHELGLFIVRTSAPQLANWRENDEAWPSDDLERVTHWAKSPLAGKDKLASTHAEAVLTVAMAMLGDHPKLEPLRAVAALGAAFGVAPPENDTDQRPARQVSAMLATSKPRQIANLSRISVLQDALVGRARADADRELLRAQSLAVELTTARETIKNLGQAVAALQAEVAGLEKANAELARKLESAERLGAHALDDLKARYRRVFRADMAPVAGDAKASLEIVPPRPEFTVDYLTTLLSIIDKELSWLDEPSE
jgi:hypothetical protein